MVAGCGGDDGGTATPTDDTGDDTGDDMGDDTGDDTGDDGEMVEMIRGTRDTPSELHMQDPWGPPDTVQHPSRWGHYLFPPLVYLFSNTRETMPVLASDFGVDGTSAFVELEDGLTWHNGDDFTTESLKIFWDIESQFIEHNEGSTLVDSYEKVSDTRFEWTLNQEIGASFVYDELLDRYYSYHPEPYGEFQQRAQDTEPGTDAFATLVTDMSNFRDVRAGGEPLVGYGPYQFVERNESSAVLDKFEDYVHADQIPIDRIRVRNVEDEIAAFQQGNTHLLRAGIPQPPDVAEQMPPLEEFGFDRFQGKAVAFNMGWNGETGDWKAGRITDDSADRNWEVDAKKVTYERPMRHAIAHILDEEFMAQAVGPTWSPFQIIEGRVSIPDIETGKFSPGDVYYNHADNSPDTEKAKELINASRDYVYEDGEVIFTPTSETAQWRILGGGAIAQSAASAVDEFGFDGSIAQNMDRMQNPVESYSDDTAMPPTTVDPAAFEIAWFKNLYATPPVQNVPEFGTIDLESNTDELDTTYNWPELKSQIATTLDPEERYSVQNPTGPIAKLTWIWNQNMPGRHICYKSFGGAINGNQFNITSDERFLGSRMSMHHVNILGLVEPA